MNFRESTQRQKWLFTAERLAEIREQNRQTSIDSLRKASERPADGHVDGSSISGPSSLQQPQALAVDEELLLLKHYQATIQHMCQELRFPRKVLGTALQYLKRFYLAHSTLDHDPQHVVVTALYLACKVEDCYISAAELSRLTGLPQELLLRGELVVLEGLRFDLIVFSPYRAIDGLIEDISACRGAAGGSGGSTVNGSAADSSDLDEGLLSLSEDQLGKARVSAFAAADALMLTDAPLLYTPGQLALAACRSGFSKIGVRLLKYIDRVAQQAAAAGGGSGGTAGEEDVQQQRRQQLQAVLAALDVLGTEGAKRPVKEEIKAIDGRLKACRAQLLDSNSAVAAAKAKARTEKQQRKAEKLRQQKAAQEAALGVADIPQPAATQQAQQAPAQEPGGEQPPAKRPRPSEPF